MKVKLEFLIDRVRFDHTLIMWYDTLRKCDTAVPTLFTKQTCRPNIWPNFYIHWAVAHEQEHANTKCQVWWSSSYLFHHLNGCFQDRIMGYFSFGAIIWNWELLDITIRLVKCFNGLFLVKWSIRPHHCCRLW